MKSAGGEIEGTRPYRMVARAEGVQETRDAILHAAVDSYWAAPADEITLEDVADRAGVSARTILRHFDSKQGLFEAAMAREGERIQAQRDAAPPDDVRAAVTVLVDHYEEMGDQVVRMLAEEQRDPALQEHADVGRDLHRQWCARVFADALEPLRGVDRDRRLAQFMAVCDVYVWKVLRRDRGLSRRQTERALVELLEPLMEGTP